MRTLKTLRPASSVRSRSDGHVKNVTRLLDYGAAKNPALAILITVCHASQMSFETPTRLGHVQALRGFAACLVLLSHLGQIEAGTVTNPILPASTVWGNMGVDLFFVISGFIMVYITRDGYEGGLKRVPEFLFARITRIYPLYWIISAALLIV